MTSWQERDGVCLKEQNYSYELEDVNPVDRHRLKLLRAEDRRLSLGLVHVKEMPCKPHGHDEFFLCCRRMILSSKMPPQNFEDMNRLIKVHMDAQHRPRHLAILDFLHKACFCKEGLGLSWSALSHEGKVDFAFDSFVGGNGFGNLYMKKSDSYFHVLRWLVDAYRHDTDSDIPKSMQESLCEATGGLLFATDTVNPQILRDYKEQVRWSHRTPKYGTAVVLSDNWSYEDVHWDDYDNAEPKAKRSRSTYM